MSEGLHKCRFCTFVDLDQVIVLHHLAAEHPQQLSSFTTFLSTSNSRDECIRKFQEPVSIFQQRLRMINQVCRNEHSPCSGSYSAYIRTWARRVVEAGPEAWLQSHHQRKIVRRQRACWASEAFRRRSVSSQK